MPYSKWDIKKEAYQQGGGDYSRKGGQEPPVRLI
jgi:hypothetical protein